MRMRIFGLISLITTIGCGSFYGDKATCDSYFATAQAKIDTLNEHSSTKTQLVTTMGEPAVILDTATTGVKSYAYFVYTQPSARVGYCGQYRITVDETKNQMDSVTTIKAYLVQ